LLAAALQQFRKATLNQLRSAPIYWKITKPARQSWA